VRGADALALSLLLTAGTNPPKRAFHSTNTGLSGGGKDCSLSGLFAVEGYSSIVEMNAR
jgi:hypothetical protein